MKKYGRKWEDMTPIQRAATVVAGVVEVALALTAWVDLARRPASLVRGKKWWWAAVIPINFVGPLSYLKWGRLSSAGRAGGGAVGPGV